MPNQKLGRRRLHGSKDAPHENCGGNVQDGSPCPGLQRLGRNASRAPSAQSYLERARRTTQLRAKVCKVLAMRTCTISTMNSAYADGCGLSSSADATRLPKPYNCSTTASGCAACATSPFSIMVCATMVINTNGALKVRRPVMRCNTLKPCELARNQHGCIILTLRMSIRIYIHMACIVA